MRSRIFPSPKTPSRSVLVRVEATSLVSYLKAYVEGRLPFYNPPPGPFTIGTNAVGMIEAIGSGVLGLKRGQRVVVSPHVGLARENVDDPAQILIGLTSAPECAEMLAEWPDGTLADYVLVPVEAVTPLDGLDAYDLTGLAALSRFIVPYGGLLRGRLGPARRWRSTARPARRRSHRSARRRDRRGARGPVARDAAASARSRRPGARVAPVALSATLQPDAKRSGEAAAAARPSPSTWSAARPRATLDAGGADEPRPRRPARADGQHDGGSADPLYGGHARRLGDFLASSCIRPAPTGGSSISCARGC